MRPAALVQLLRPHQWAKNLLVFVPLITSHSWSRPYAWFGAVMAFVAMSMLASAGYALNDALDAERDRVHPEKCKRPIAAGVLPRWLGFAAAAVLAIVALLGVFIVTFPVTGMLPVGDALLFALPAYLAGTVAYSFWFKRVAIADVCALSLLYVVRIVAGAGAINVPISPWLLAFAGFVFLSLAMVKRVIEYQQRGDAAGDSRPYRNSDLPMLEMAGIGAALCSVLVLALYTQSEDVRKLYAEPDLIFLLCPIMLYWLLRVWLRTRRLQLPGDPVLFAVRDAVSWVCAGLMLLVVLWAS
jgi:4-hydroxybenzoate polyprenyltransferase